MIISKRAIKRFDSSFLLPLYKTKTKGENKMPKTKQTIIIKLKIFIHKLFFFIILFYPISMQKSTYFDIICFSQQKKRTLSPFFVCFLQFNFKFFNSSVFFWKRYFCNIFHRFFCLCLFFIYFNFFQTIFSGIFIQEFAFISC